MCLRRWSAAQEHHKGLKKKKSRECKTDQVDHIDHMKKKNLLKHHHQVSKVCNVPSVTLLIFGKFILVSIICYTYVTIGPYGVECKQNKTDYCGF